MGPIFFSKENSLNLFLRPFKILANFASITETILEALASLCKASLRLLLQFKQLTMLSVQVSRPALKSAN